MREVLFEVQAESVLGRDVPWMVGRLTIDGHVRAIGVGEQANDSRLLGD
jgi:hypothetical protein